MKISELKELLNDFDDHVEVYISSDAEGNRINRLIEVSLYSVGEQDGDEKFISEFFEDSNLDIEDEVLVMWPV